MRMHNMSVVGFHMRHSVVGLGGNVSAQGARRASFLTRALPVDFCR